MKLYENIKELRIERHWSQQDLAEKVGYTDRSSIAKIESGQVDLSRSKIVLFAKVFGVEPSDLMGIDDPAELKTEIMVLYDQLTKEQQDAVLQFLRSMIARH